MSNLAVLSIHLRAEDTPYPLLFYICKLGNVLTLDYVLHWGGSPELHKLSWGLPKRYVR